jgi:hypothetical protein
MRIDSSGNVGIGTSSPVSQLTLAKTSDLVFTQNNYGIAWGGDNGSPKIYGTSGGLLSFKHGGGSVGMVIDSSGNVGIGTSSPIRKLTVSTAGAAEFVLQDTSQAADSRNWRIFNTGASMYFGTLNDAGSSGTDVIILNRAGNVGIGGGTPGSNPKLSMYGGIRFMSTEAATATYTGIGSIASDTVSISTSGSERMRVDTGGIVLVGATSARTTEAKIELTSAANTALSFYMFKNTQVEMTMGFKSSTDSNFYIGTGSTLVGTNGVYLTNTGNSWNAVSDARMKTIVEPIQNASAKVATLRTVIGYYNSDTTQTRRPFLIAQDVQAVLPEAVNVQNLETGTLGMSYTDTIPLLVAAIKEQQILITSLTARIAALEST